MEESNSKKCEICGLTFEENTYDRVFVYDGHSICKNCKPIYELKHFISNEWHLHRDDLDSNGIYQRNYYKDSEQEVSGVTSYTLGENETTYEVIGRDKLIEELIEKIDYVRKYLLTDVGPQFEILDSIYIKKNIFWEEGGNLRLYVHASAIQSIVIRLKDLLSGARSKYSIEKIRNIITNNKKHIFENQKVYEVVKFEKSGDVVKSEFKEFPILEFLDK